MVTWLHQTNFKTRMNFVSLPSHRTMTYHLLDLSPTSANRQTPLKYCTTQTVPSYAGTMNSLVTWQSHTENAARFTDWWRAQIWAGLLQPRPCVHWVDVMQGIVVGSGFGWVCDCVCVGVGVGEWVGEVERASDDYRGRGRGGASANAVSPPMHHWYILQCN